ncbi:transposase [Gracilimonas mengyeensis]|uniref:Transposase IS200 like n=1 Tax=Gracilimonas mengyeensis TaxID=1302730 RepID=A0A521F0M5_9BACT|nr:transposase [Gracilimonas mengyeensis]SMO89709.1 Transposase IS200 like [Gracilimonas mengyeensis]
MAGQICPSYVLVDVLVSIQLFVPKSGCCIMNFYRRKLPHWQPHGAEYFVTFRLAGSIPKKVITKLKAEKEQLFGKYVANQDSTEEVSDIPLKIHKYIFKKYDDYLDDHVIGPTWLAEKEVAKVVTEAIYFRDDRVYELYAYCIMPNHVHLVFRLLNAKSINPEENEDFPVTKILHGLKWYSALKANRVLGRTGNSFWQSESYDHVIRDTEELERIIFYTLYNPVKAGLIDGWEDWPFSYCKPEFRERFSQP